MCWTKGLGDPNVLVCCGITAHARKVSVYMFFIFMIIFGTGIFVLRNCALCPDPPQMILFWYCVGNVVLLAVNFFGVFTSFKPFLISGFLVHGGIICILTVLTLELGVAVVCPTWKVPSPLLGYYLNISILQLDKNWLMRLIGALITLNLFFFIQVPTTFFIAQLKIWKEISILDEYDKNPHVTIINVENGEMGNFEEVLMRSAMATD